MGLQDAGKINTIPIKRIAGNLGRAIRVAVNTLQAAAVPDEITIKALAIETSTNLDLNGDETIDGVDLNDGDVVAVAAQSTASENGIYIVDTLGDWSRITNEMISGGLVSVLEGSAYSDTLWMIDVDPAGYVPDTDDLAFVQIAGGSGGAGLEVPENTLFVSPSYSALSAPYYDTISAAISAASSGQTIVVFTGTYDETLTLSGAKDYDIHCIGDVVITQTSAVTSVVNIGAGTRDHIRITGDGLILAGGSASKLIENNASASQEILIAPKRFESSGVLYEDNTTSTGVTTTFQSAEGWYYGLATAFLLQGLGAIFVSVDWLSFGLNTGFAFQSTNANELYVKASLGDFRSNTYAFHFTGGEFDVDIDRVLGTVSNAFVHSSVVGSVRIGRMSYASTIVRTASSSSARVNVDISEAINEAGAIGSWDDNDAPFRCIYGTLVARVGFMRHKPAAPVFRGQSNGDLATLEVGYCEMTDGASGASPYNMIQQEGTTRMEIAGAFKNLENSATGHVVELQTDGLILRAGTALVTTHASANSIISSGGSYTCYAYGDSVANAATDGSTTVAIGALNVNAAVV